jgi:hypothetical protein
MGERRLRRQAEVAEEARLNAGLTGCCTSLLLGGWLAAAKTTGRGGAQHRYSLHRQRSTESLLVRFFGLVVRPLGATGGGHLSRNCACQGGNSFPQGWSTPVASGTGQSASMDMKEMTFRVEPPQLCELYVAFTCLPDNSAASPSLIQASRVCRETLQSALLSAP